MTPRRLLLGVVALVVLACLAGSARAVDGPYYWNWGGYFNYPPYVGYSQYRVPYFALYPPVYYSGLTPRSYGQSPFAYPALPPASEAATAAQAAQPQPAPLRIVNPYVSEREVSTPVRPAGEVRTPLVVYPAMATAVADR
jgi:hypothetical protein